MSSPRSISITLFVSRAYRSTAVTDKTLFPKPLKAYPNNVFTIGTCGTTTTVARLNFLQGFVVGLSVRSAAFVKSFIIYEFVNEI